MKLMGTVGDFLVFLSWPLIAFAFSFIFLGFTLHWCILIAGPGITPGPTAERAMNPQFEKSIGSVLARNDNVNSCVENLRAAYVQMAGNAGRRPRPGPELDTAFVWMLCRAAKKPTVQAKLQ